MDNLRKLKHHLKTPQYKEGGIGVVLNEGTYGTGFYDVDYHGGEFENVPVVDLITSKIGMSYCLPNQVVNLLFSKGKPMIISSSPSNSSSDIKEFIDTIIVAYWNQNDMNYKHNRFSDAQYTPTVGDGTNWYKKMLTFTGLKTLPANLRCYKDSGDVEYILFNLRDGTENQIKCYCPSTDTYPWTYIWETTDFDSLKRGDNIDSFHLPSSWTDYRILADFTFNDPLEVPGVYTLNFDLRDSDPININFGVSAYMEVLLDYVGANRHAIPDVDLVSVEGVETESIPDIDLGYGNYASLSISGTIATITINISTLGSYFLEYLDWTLNRYPFFSPVVANYSDDPDIIKTWTGSYSVTNIGQFIDDSNEYLYLILKVLCSMNDGVLITDYTDLYYVTRKIRLSDGTLISEEIKTINEPATYDYSDVHNYRFSLRDSSFLCDFTDAGGVFDWTMVKVRRNDGQPHGLIDGMNVNITGTTDYDGRFTIQDVDGTDFYLLFTHYHSDRQGYVSIEANSIYTNTLETKCLKNDIIYGKMDLSYFYNDGNIALDFDASCYYFKETLSTFVTLFLLVNGQITNIVCSDNDIIIARTDSVYNWVIEFRNDNLTIIGQINGMSAPIDYIFSDGTYIYYFCDNVLSAKRENGTDYWMQTMVGSPKGKPCVNDSGEIYVNSQVVGVSNQIAKITSSEITYFNTGYTETGDVLVDRDGNIYWRTTHRFQVFDNDGNSLVAVGLSPANSWYDLILGAMYVIMYNTVAKVYLV